ncbi:site-specific integrase [Cellulomonas sp. URHB0016]
MASITKRPDGKWRARYRDAAGKEHSRHFDRKVDGQQWLNTVTASVVRGDYVDPQTARTTVEAWCSSWLEGYGTRRRSTVRQAEVHVAKIVETFGPMRLADVKPSAVKSWCSKLKAEGAADSYVYALHARLSQIMSDAVHDGVIPRNPCSRRTSPGAGKQRPYVATVEQLWALHDVVPEHLRAAILLGAFAGLRTAEACGLRVVDVDFMRGIVSPAVQYPADPLKTETSRTPIPIPAELALALAAGADQRTWIVEQPTGEQVGPWQIERAVRSARVALAAVAADLADNRSADERDIAAARARVLPAAFRFHDLRHLYASLLIASGADVKVVQARLRHASATTTLNTYTHLWPDTEESTRAAIGAAMTARADQMRTEGVS